MKILDRIVTELFRVAVSFGIIGTVYLALQTLVAAVG